MTQRTFYQRHGMLILMITFFLVPFAIRGSRMAIRSMRNEVKDWLPAGFEETKELDEFRRQFYGEAFVVVSWDGCTGSPEDHRFKLFVDKLVPEVPPSQRAKEADAGTTADRSSRFYDEELQRYVGRLDSRTIAKRKDFIGNKLGLYLADSLHQNWGGKNERWLQGEREQWYYILPNGDLYRWLGTDSPMAGIYRWLKECVVARELRGDHIATLGPMDGPWYYQNPGRLEADVIKSCTTGPSLLYDLTKEGGVLEGETPAALERLQGWLFGPDGKQSCLFITLSERGRQNLHHVLGRGLIGRQRGKLLAVADASGLSTPPRPSMWPAPLDRIFDRPAPASTGPVIRLGGPPVDNVAIDEEGQVTLIRLVGLSIGVGLLISWLSFRSFTVVATLTFVGMVSAQASLAFVGWSGNLLDAILMSMPSLIYVLGLSGAVHLLNYYRDTVFENGYPGSPEQAVREGFFPLFLAAFTTALGLLSLVPSDIVPIRRFGLYSAIGVMFTLILLFTFLPAVMALWPPKSFAQQALLRKTNPRADRLHNFWQAIGRFTIRHHMPILVGGLAIAMFAAFGLRNVETSVQLLKLFDPRSKLIRDYAWLETNLGKLVPMELVVRVPDSQMRKREFEENDEADVAEKFQLSFLDRMEIGEHIRRSVDEHFGEKRGKVVGTAMLASTFVPPLPDTGGSGLQLGFRGAFSRRLAIHRDDLQASDYFRIDQDNSELWRVSLRLGALTDVDYGRFVVSLKAAVEPVLAAYRYREAILRAVDAERQGRSSRGARVLLVADRDKLVHKPVASAEQNRNVEQGTAIENTTPESVRQDVIFLRTLALILQNSAITCKIATDSKLLNADRTANPADATLERKRRRESLADFDCVVLTSPLQEWERAKERGELPAVIQATDFRFDPLRESLTARAKDWPVTVTYTGLVPVVYKAQRTLLNSLIQSTWSAFVSIALTMIIVLRSIPAGTLAMVPNLFPVVMVFGVMGFTHIKIDIGTMMTASIALGIAVDDTVHYLTWFRRALERGLSRNEAILDSFGRCASSMTETALIAGLGLSVFGFSTFTPTKRFGILMLIILVTGVVGELIMTTALLASPLGRIFERPSRKKNGPSVPPEPRPEPANHAADDAPLGNATPLAMELHPHTQFMRNLSSGQRPLK